MQKITPYSRGRDMNWVGFEFVVLSGHYAPVSSSRDPRFHYLLKKGNKSMAPSLSYRLHSSFLGVSFTYLHTYNAQLGAECEK